MDQRELHATKQCVCLIAKDWSRRFDEPILLADGRKLRTLQEAIAWLAKEIPKSEHTAPKVQAADVVFSVRKALGLSNGRDYHRLLVERQPG